MIDKCLTSKLVLNFIDAFQLSALFGFFTTISAMHFPDLQAWFIINESYVNIALGVIIIDHLLGSLVHSNLYKKDFSFKKNITGLGVKLSMVVAFAFLMEGLAHITIEDDFIYRYIKMSGRILVVLYPGVSAMKNIHIVTGGRFPHRYVIGNWEKVSENGDIRNIVNKKEENE